MKRPSSPILIGSFLACLAVGPLVSIGCGSDTPAPVTPTAATSASSSAPAPMPTPMPSPSATVAIPVPPAAPVPAIVVEDMVPSEDPKPLPKVEILAPTQGESIGDPVKALDYKLKLKIKDWPTEMGGPHVHLILDNYPYFPVYKEKDKLKLSHLIPDGVTLTEGEHVIHAFPSRMTHETVKAGGKGDIASVTFWVGKKGKPTIDLKAPLVIYSRPKGKYDGSKAASVLLDFYLRNTDLSDGRKVRATLNGPGLDTALVVTFDKWVPKQIKNLHKGKYTLTLELINKDGTVDGNPLNATTRKFEVDPDAPDAPPPAASASGMASGTPMAAPSGTAK